MSRCHALFIFLTTLFLGANAFALSIEKLRFGIHETKTRMVLELSNPTDFRVFVMPNPYRMVIDLPDFAWNAGVIKSPPHAGIRAIRHGPLEQGISRIVFDLEKPVGVRAAFALPRDGNTPDRIVIDFNPVSANTFSNETAKILGSLAIAAPTLNESPPAPVPNPYESASINTLAPPEMLDPPAEPAPGKRPLIVIDPGHGGVDPGAVGRNKVFEKHVTLALAKALKDALESSGQYDVKLTRDKDVFIKLGDRVKFARKNGADLFISIHADSIDKHNVSGASVYTLSEKASDAQTEKLAQRENKVDLIAGIDLSVEDEEVANILVDLAMRDTMNQSKFFAGKIVDMYNRNDLHLLDSPHRSAGFAVLKAPDIPSVLVEAGFMSNNQEVQKLNTPAYRKKVATTLKKGIDAYFDQVRKNQRI